MELRELAIAMVSTVWENRKLLAKVSRITAWSCKGDFEKQEYKEGGASTSYYNTIVLTASHKILCFGSPQHRNTGWRPILLRK